MVKSQCIAQDCSAASPEIIDRDISYFPTEVRKIFKIKGSNEFGRSFKECSYCGTIWTQWVEYIDENKSISHEKIIGIRIIDSGETNWIINR